MPNLLDIKEVLRKNKVQNFFHIFRVLKKYNKYELQETTNMFLDGKETVPGGITIIGGKTGTTNDAGKCLILYCKNKKGNDQILIVLKAGSKELLYQHMRKMMEEFSNL